MTVPTDTPEALTRFLVMLNSHTREEIQASVAEMYPTWPDFDATFEAALADRVESEEQLTRELDAEALEQEHRA